MRAAAEMFAAILLSSILLIYAGYILLEWNKMQNAMLNVNSWLQKRASVGSSFVQCICASLTITLSKDDFTINPGAQCFCYAYNFPDLNEQYSRGGLVVLALLNSEGVIEGMAFVKGTFSSKDGYIKITLQADKKIIFGDPTEGKQAVLILYDGEFEVPLFCFNTTISGNVIKVGSCSG